MSNFNERVKQILMLLIIVALMVLVIMELINFLPGLLGAVTLYIVSRTNYFHLVFQKKWRKGWTALAFIIFYLLIVGIPVAIGISIISPKISSLLEQPDSIVTATKSTITTIQEKTGFTFISENTVSSAIGKFTSILPKLLNSTLNIITNIAIMLFVLYFMLVNGNQMEKYLNRIIPLKRNNIQRLSNETKKMVIANALGIPLISVIQGLVATLGYLIFGVKEWALYGFLTGVFAFFPVIGTMIVWVPLVLYMYATGDTTNALLVTLYSIIVTGNIDYVARITLLKRMGNVHPVMTVLGVLVGLGLFGFVGLVFGPLLINYIIVMYEIYMNEFVYNDAASSSDKAK
jgi:predicted PurR-regulated permease PerM